MRKSERQMDLRTDYLRKLGYEPRDVALQALIKWFVGLIIFILISAGITYAIYDLFVAPEVPMDTLQPITGLRKLPPAPNPLLQARPRDDLRTFRAQEFNRLDGYGWVDQSKGVVRIPVDRAIDVLAQKGLPARPQQTGPIPGEGPIAVQAGSAATGVPPATQTTKDSPTGGTAAPGTPLVPPPPATPAASGG